MSAYVLAHLSDPHLPPLPAALLRELVGKRALGYLNWRRNRHLIHRRDVLDQLVADLHAQQPDHIAITGDLVNLALPAEFAPARRWLDGVGPPERVTIIPGNHDAYVRATRRRFAQAFGDFLRDDDAGASDAITYPFVQRRGPLTLIATSTAVPTAPFMATGRLGAAQLAALDHVLGARAAEPTFRVLLIHHPLRPEHHGRFKRLTDADALLGLLKRHGVDLILHGHDHVHSTMWLEGPRGRIPAIGVPSASAVAHGHHPAAAYNLFRIMRDGEGWRCEQNVRGFIESKGFRDIRRVMLI
ncbi:MAG: metallophosphoesterase [Xanthobacteraceae bacterium]|nr:metallophosphoesterase [Xanthobacteraceae bacterium]